MVADKGAWERVMERPVITLGVTRMQELATGYEVGRLQFGGFLPRAAKGWTLGDIEEKCAGHTSIILHPACDSGNGIGPRLGKSYFDKE